MSVLNLAQSQQNDGVITIINGSFEGIPQCCMPPQGWQNCGFMTETPTDIQPVLPPGEALFKVTKKHLFSLHDSFFRIFEFECYT